MITDTPTVINPCLYAHQLPQLYQGQGGPAFDSRIKEAFSLADQLGVTPSCETICTLDARLSAPIGETTLFLLDDGHDLEPFGYPLADLPPVPSLDAVMADMSSTAAYLVELSSGDEKPAQVPPTKWKRTCGSCGSRCCAIEPPPTDHWSESDDKFVDIYSSVNGDTSQATSLDDGWLHMIRSAPSASIAPQCSCSALSTYMHDGQVAHSVPAISDFVFANVNIACSCSDCMNHSKECACKHEDDGRIFWILDSGTSTHFTLHCLGFVDYVALKGDDYIPVQTAGGVIHVTGCGHMLV